MSGIWRKVQCRVFSNHQWQQKRVDGETVLVCRDCRKPLFVDADDIEKIRESFGGGVGGP
jgi:hypothetical protein